MVKKVAPYCRRHRKIALLILLLAIQTLSFATVSDSLPTFRMIATFYADKFHGRKTSSGEIFDQNKATAAHTSIKLGTYVRVTNIKNGQNIIVKINDRCPKKGVIDLTRSAARKIGIRGTAPVLVEILPAEMVATMQKENPLNEPQKTDFSSTKKRIPNQSSKKTQPTKTKKEQPTPQKTNPANKQNTKKQNNNKKSRNNYTILLVQTTTQQQAQQEIEKLPILYRENVKMTANKDHSKILVTMDLFLTQKQAEEIHKSIRKVFPNCKITQRAQ